MYKFKTKTMKDGIINIMQMINVLNAKVMWYVTYES